MGQKHYDAPGAVLRLPGESFASFSARQRASQEAGRAASQSAAKPKRTRRATKFSRNDETFETRSDDIGESPDY